MRNDRSYERMKIPEVTLYLKRAVQDLLTRKKKLKPTLQIFTINLQSLAVFVCHCNLVVIIIAKCSTHDNH